MAEQPKTPEEQKREEERQRQERERQRQEREKQGGKPKEGEQEKIGSPMRDDDRQNFFRAPDSKANGAIFGEDMTHPRARKAEEIDELPPDTHPQKAGPEAKEEDEEELAAPRRR